MEDADRLRAVVVRAYRVMAYVTGTLLIVLCFVGIPLQVFAGNDAIVKVVGAAHGFLYIVYLVVAFVMTLLVRIRTLSLTTVIVLAAGTIPILTFVVERWVTRRYINPAMDAGQAGPAAREAASSGQHTT